MTFVLLLLYRRVHVNFFEMKKMINALCLREMNNSHFDQSQYLLQIKEYVDINSNDARKGKFSSTVLYIHN